MFAEEDAKLVETLLSGCAECDASAAVLGSRRADLCAFLARHAERSCAESAIAATSAAAAASEEGFAGDAAAKAADARLRELAQTQHKTVLRSAAAVADAYERTEPLGARLCALADGAPRLQAALADFLAAGRATVAKCRAIQQAFRELPRVAELLELPALAATCVRCGAYEEALQLGAHARRLGSRSQTLGAVAAEADVARRSLQRALEDALRGPAQLPAIVRAVGLLSRIGAYGDGDARQLRTAFLLCRDAHIAETAAACAAAEPLLPARRIARIADVVRTGVFDVVTQFRALFPSDSDSTNADDEGAALLHSWAAFRVGWFLSLLERDLASVREGNALANLLDQCMYLGLSLGRVGLDIRESVAAVFARRISALFEGSLRDAVEQVRAALSSHKFVRTRLPVLPTPPSAASPASSYGASARMSPAMSLLDQPPLAVFVNTFTSALNELRQCAPLSLRNPLTRVLDRNLREVVALLLARADAADPADHLSVEAFVEAACDDAVPYITRCFDLIWSSPVPLLHSADIVAPLERLCNRPAPSTTAVADASAATEAEGPLLDRPDMCDAVPDSPCLSLAPLPGEFQQDPEDEPPKKDEPLEFAAPELPQDP